MDMYGQICLESRQNLLADSAHDAGVTDLNKREGRTDQRGTYASKKKEESFSLPGCLYSMICQRWGRISSSVCLNNSNKFALRFWVSAYVNIYSAT